MTVGAVDAAVAVVDQLVDEPTAVRGRVQRAQSVQAAVDAVARLLAFRERPQEAEEATKACVGAVSPVVSTLLRLCSVSARSGDTAMVASVQDSLHRTCSAFVQRGGDSVQREVFAALSTTLRSEPDAPAQKVSLQVFAALCRHAEADSCKDILRLLVPALAHALDQGCAEVLSAYGEAAKDFGPALLPGADHAQHRQLWVPTLGLLSSSDGAVRRSGALAAVAILTHARPGDLASFAYHLLDRFTTVGPDASTAIAREGMHEARGCVVGLSELARSIAESQEAVDAGSQTRSHTLGAAASCLAEVVTCVCAAHASGDLLDTALLSTALDAAEAFLTSFDNCRRTDTIALLQPAGWEDAARKQWSHVVRKVGGWSGRGAEGVTAHCLRHLSHLAALFPAVITDGSADLFCKLTAHADPAVRSAAVLACGGAASGLCRDLSDAGRAGAVSGILARVRAVHRAWLFTSADGPPCPYTQRACLTAYCSMLPPLMMGTDVRLHSEAAAAAVECLELHGAAREVERGWGALWTVPAELLLLCRRLPWGAVTAPSAVQAPCWWALELSSHLDARVKHRAWTTVAQLADCLPHFPDPGHLTPPHCSAAACCRTAPPRQSSEGLDVEACSIGRGAAGPMVRCHGAGAGDTLAMEDAGGADDVPHRGPVLTTTAAAVRHNLSVLVPHVLSKLTDADPLPWLGLLHAIAARFGSAAARSPLAPFSDTAARLLLSTLARLVDGGAAPAPATLAMVFATASFFLHDSSGLIGSALYRKVLQIATLWGLAVAGAHRQVDAVLADPAEVHRQALEMWGDGQEGPRFLSHQAIRSIIDACGVAHRGGGAQHDAAEGCPAPEGFGGLCVSVLELLTTVVREGVDQQAVSERHDILLRIGGHLRIYQPRAALALLEAVFFTIFGHADPAKYPSLPAPPPPPFAAAPRSRASTRARRTLRPCKTQPSLNVFLGPVLEAINLFLRSTDPAAQEAVLRLLYGLHCRGVDFTKLDPPPHPFVTRLCETANHHADGWCGDAEATDASAPARLPRPVPLLQLLHHLLAFVGWSRVPASRPSPSAAVRNIILRSIESDTPRLVEALLPLVDGPGASPSVAKALVDHLDALSVREHSTWASAVYYGPYMLSALTRLLCGTMQSRAQQWLPSVAGHLSRCADCGWAGVGSGPSSMYALTTLCRALLPPPPETAFARPRPLEPCVDHLRQRLLVRDAEDPTTRAVDLAVAAALDADLGSVVAAVLAHVLRFGTAGAAALSECCALCNLKLGVGGAGQQLARQAGRLLRTLVESHLQSCPGPLLRAVAELLGTADESSAGAAALTFRRSLTSIGQSWLQGEIGAAVPLRTAGSADILVTAYMALLSRTGSTQGWAYFITSPHCWFALFLSSGSSQRDACRAAGVAVANVRGGAEEPRIDAALATFARALVGRFPVQVWSFIDVAAAGSPGPLCRAALAVAGGPDSADWQAFLGCDKKQRSVDVEDIGGDGALWALFRRSCRSPWDSRSLQLPHAAVAELCSTRDAAGDAAWAACAIALREADPAVLADCALTIPRGLGSDRAAAPRVSELLRLACAAVTAAAEGCLAALAAPRQAADGVFVYAPCVASSVQRQELVWGETVRAVPGAEGEGVVVQFPSGVTTAVDAADLHDPEAGAALRLAATSLRRSLFHVARLLRAQLRSSAAAGAAVLHPLLLCHCLAFDLTPIPSHWDWPCCLSSMSLFALAFEIDVTDLQPAIDMNQQPRMPTWQALAASAQPGSRLEAVQRHVPLSAVWRGFIARSCVAVCGSYSVPLSLSKGISPPCSLQWPLQLVAALLKRKTPVDPGPAALTLGWRIVESVPEPFFDPILDELAAETGTDSVPSSQTLNELSLFVAGAGLPPHCADRISVLVARSARQALEREEDGQEYDPALFVNAVELCGSVVAHLAQGPLDGVAARPPRVHHHLATVALPELSFLETGADPQGAADVSYYCSTVARAADACAPAELSVAYEASGWLGRATPSRVGRSHHWPPQLPVASLTLARPMKLHCTAGGPRRWSVRSGASTRARIMWSVPDQTRLTFIERRNGFLRLTPGWVCRTDGWRLSQDAIVAGSGHALWVLHGREASRIRDAPGPTARCLWSALPGWLVAFEHDSDATSDYLRVAVGWVQEAADGGDWRPAPPDDLCRAATAPLTRFDKASATSVCCAAEAAALLLSRTAPGMANRELPTTIAAVVEKLPRDSFPLRDGARLTDDGDETRDGLVECLVGSPRVPTPTTIDAAEPVCLEALGLCSVLIGGKDLHTIVANISDTHCFASPAYPAAVCTTADLRRDTTHGQALLKVLPAVSSRLHLDVSAADALCGALPHVFTSIVEMASECLAAAPVESEQSGLARQFWESLWGVVSAATRDSTHSIPMALRTAAVCHFCRWLLRDELSARQRRIVETSADVPSPTALSPGRERERQLLASMTAERSPSSAGERTKSRLTRLEEKMSRVHGQQQSPADALSPRAGTPVESDAGAAPIGANAVYADLHSMLLLGVTVAAAIRSDDSQDRSQRAAFDLLRQLRVGRSQLHRGAEAALTAAVLCLSRTLAWHHSLPLVLHDAVLSPSTSPQLAPAVLPRILRSLVSDPESGGAEGDAMWVWVAALLDGCLRCGPTEAVHSAAAVSAGVAYAAGSAAALPVLCDLAASPPPPSGSIPPRLRAQFSASARAFCSAARRLNSGRWEETRVGLRERLDKTPEAPHCIILREGLCDAEHG